MHPDSVLELKPAMPPSIQSAHPMQIRSKSAIFKPKHFTAECLQEPPTASINCSHYSSLEASHGS